MGDNQQGDAALGGLGPMAGLIGVWEGNDGIDISPGMPDQTVTDTETGYRERWELELVSPAVNNHDQKLRQLKFFTSAWRADPSPAGHTGGEPFHGQFGYLVWDATSKQLVHSFAVPRGIVINAGATVEPDAKSFELVAKSGSETYGICQNQELLKNFKVVRYVLTITLNDDDSIDYEQDTQLQMPGRELFHHTDANHLERLS